MSQSVPKSSEELSESRPNVALSYPSWVKDFIDHQIDEAIARYKRPSPNYRSKRSQTTPRRPRSAVTDRYPTSMLGSHDGNSGHGAPRLHSLI